MIPLRHKRIWGIREKHSLEQNYREGRSIEYLARMHSRSPEAIKTRLKKLGITHRCEAQTRTTFNLTIRKVIK